MTVSMRVTSAGDGYKYLLRSVVAADNDRSLSTPLTRYYVAEGMLWGCKRVAALIGKFLRFLVYWKVSCRSCCPQRR